MTKLFVLKWISAFTNASLISLGHSNCGVFYSFRVWKPVRSNRNVPLWAALRVILHNPNVTLGPQFHLRPLGGAAWLIRAMWLLWAHLIPVKSAAGISFSWEERAISEEKRAQSQTRRLIPSRFSLTYFFFFVVFFLFWLFLSETVRRWATGTLRPKVWERDYSEAASNPSWMWKGGRRFFFFFFFVWCHRAGGMYPTWAAAGVWRCPGWGLWVALLLHSALRLSASGESPKKKKKYTSKSPHPPSNRSLLGFSVSVLDIQTGCWTCFPFFFFWYSFRFQTSPNFGHFCFCFSVSDCLPRLCCLAELKPCLSSFTPPPPTSFSSSCKSVVGFEMICLLVIVGKDLAAVGDNRGALNKSAGWLLWPPTTPSII